MGFHGLVNTQYFKEAGLNFFKNGGKYTLAPRGSMEYHEFWKEEERRCREGYSVGDTWITGRHYWHLNFQPMQRVKDNVRMSTILEDQTHKGKLSRTVQKEFNFGFFSEMQYEWWRLKHIAWHGGEFMGIVSPGGKHMVCGKTREAGFSYMDAADGTYNYNFIPMSKSFYTVSKEPYLTDDGILNKVQVGLDWINDMCPYWKQNRHKKNSLSDHHFKASFVDSFGEERGSMSEIMGVVINKDPNKMRGKRGIKITFEEAGSFQDLMATLEIAKGNISAGTQYMGQITVFGTGGEEGPSIEGLETLFTNPDAHDFLALPNIYEAGAFNEKVGYFVPCFKTNFAAIDQDGNIDYKKAIALDDEKRTMAKKDKNPKALDRRTAEYPRKPSELFQRLHRNDFNVNEIDAQIRKITTNPSIANMLVNGDFVSATGAYSLGGLEFVPDPAARPITAYPHNQTEDLKGCVTILQKPYTDERNLVPDGMYVVVFDSFYKDDAEDLTSLFDIRVFKQFNRFDNSYHSVPVAWFTGRPSLTRCYEILFNLCRYYNAKAQGEISGGGQGVLDYARQRHLLHFLEYEPEILSTTETTGTKKNKSFLMNMSTDRKLLGLAYLAEWHMEQRGLDLNGHPIYNVHQIYDVGLLRELRTGGAKNADRMSSSLIAMFMLKEKVYQELEVKQETNEFWTRELFPGGSTEEVYGETTTLY